MNLKFRKLFATCVHVVEEESTLRLELHREEAIASRLQSRSGIRQNFGPLTRRIILRRPPKVCRLPLQPASTILYRCLWPKGLTARSFAQSATKRRRIVDPWVIPMVLPPPSCLANGAHNPVPLRTTPERLTHSSFTWSRS